MLNLPQESLLSAKRPIESHYYSVSFANLSLRPMRISKFAIGVILCAYMEVFRAVHMYIMANTQQTAVTHPRRS